MEIPALHLRQYVSNARNVTQVNGRGSFNGFMDLTVASSWRW